MIKIDDFLYVDAVRSISLVQDDDFPRGKYYYVHVNGERIQSRDSYSKDSQRSYIDRILEEVKRRTMCEEL